MISSVKNFLLCFLLGASSFALQATPAPSVVPEPKQIVQMLSAKPMPTQKDLESFARPLGLQVVSVADKISIDKLKLGELAFVLSQDGKRFQLIERRSAGSIIGSRLFAVLWTKFASSLFSGIVFHLFFGPSAVGRDLSSSGESAKYLLEVKNAMEKHKATLNAIGFLSWIAGMAWAMPTYAMVDHNNFFVRFDGKFSPSRAS